jgi:hypothetical protein
MPTSRLSHVVRHLRAAAVAGGDWPTDGQLLQAFVRRRDAEALAALVRRHAPMVRGVCRRLLGHEQDAFQATFLVLVRKAAAVVPADRVGNWLYGVARQTAVKARATLSAWEAAPTSLSRCVTPAGDARAPACRPRSSRGCRRPGG